MSEAGPWIALSSLVVSVAVLLFGARGYQRLARKDYAEELQAEIDRLSARLDQAEQQVRELTRRYDDCERERDRLTRLTTDLMLEARTLAEARAREQQAPPPPAS